MIADHVSLPGEMKLGLIPKFLSFYYGFAYCSRLTIFCLIPEAKQALLSGRALSASCIAFHLYFLWLVNYVRMT